MTNSDDGDEAAARAESLVKSVGGELVFGVKAYVVST